MFNLLKSKIGKKGKGEEEKEKGKDIQMKIRKSSLKRFGANTIINFVAKTRTDTMYNKILIKSCCHLLSCW